MKKTNEEDTKKKCGCNNQKKMKNKQYMKSMNQYTFSAQKAFKKLRARLFMN